MGEPSTHALHRQGRGIPGAPGGAQGDLLYTFTHAWFDGTRGITLSPLALLEKLAALVPPPRVHQVRYGGCLAAHSKLRGAITPTPRQQGIEAEASPASSRWAWARLLKRVFTLDLERCPRCHQDILRIIAAITSRPIMRRILRHLKLAAAPRPLRRRAWSRRVSPGPLPKPPSLTGVAGTTQGRGASGEPAAIPLLPPE